MIRRILYEARWWKWFLSGNAINEQRWLDAEPHFDEYYPNRLNRDHGE